MKKRLCALALCLLLLAVFPTFAFAEQTQTEPELTVSCERASDTQLTVTVSIDHNVGIAGFEIDLSITAGEALLSAPETTLGAAWQGENSFFVDNVAGNHLYVVCARANDITSDGALFTASFTLSKSDFDKLEFSAEGVAYSADGTEVRFDSAEKTVYGDALWLSVSAPALVKSGSKISGTVDCELGSYDSGYNHGIGYQGTGKAILSCYQGGRFIGCSIKNIDIAINSVNAIQFTEVSFNASGVGEVTCKLMVVKDNYVPLCTAIIDGLIVTQ